MTDSGGGLRRARLDMRLSQQEFAHLLERLAREKGEAIDCSVRLVRRWESGAISCPRPVYQRLLEQATGRPIGELGFNPPDSPSGSSVPDVSEHLPAARLPVENASGPEVVVDRATPTRTPWIRQVVLDTLGFGGALTRVGLAVSLVGTVLALAVTVLLTLTIAERDRWEPPHHQPPTGPEAPQLPVKIYGPTVLAPGTQGLYYAAVPTGSSFYWVVDNTRTEAKQGLSVTMPTNRPTATVTLVTLNGDESRTTTLTITAASPGTH